MDNLNYRRQAAVSPKAALELAAYTPLEQQLLVTRGITTAKEAADFFAPDFEAQLHDPFLLSDMDAACRQISDSLSKNESIAIFSDYDCDGIPGAVVLYDFFTAISYQNFQNYIPHRHFEGFGLSVGAVEKLAGEGVKLIITIDCGTTDVEAVKRANELGCRVIITDHHEPQAELPAAVAIINPKLNNYPFPHLCGAGVVFKLIQALIKTGQYELIPGREKWWLDLVGIATIADMVPLVGENRVLAHYGLMVLRKSRRPGLQHLYRKVRLNQRYLTEDDIGFTIGPRINAASRMDAPERAFLMLATSEEAEAGAAVAHLESLNNERKGVVAAMTREMHARLKEAESLPEVFVFGNPNWRPALVGLVANKLSEEHNRPVFLWGRDGNGVIKGSCRSGGNISVVRLMEASAGSFSEFGGHHMSGGFSVLDSAIFSLSETLNKAYLELGAEAKIAGQPLVDAEISLSDLPLIQRSLSQFAPFGTGNPKPLFAVTNVTPRFVTWFGKGNEHLKLQLADGDADVEAIAFFAQHQTFTKTPAANDSCTVLAHIEDSFFMGRRQRRLRIIDVV